MSAPVPKLRIYADFNSSMGDERGLWCWCLCLDGGPLEGREAELGLYEGLPIIVYWEDPSQEWEMDAILGHLRYEGWEGRWCALPDNATFRTIRS